MTKTLRQNRVSKLALLVCALAYPCAAGPKAIVYNSSIFPGGDDSLFQFDMLTGEVEILGFIGATNIEAIETLPDGRWIGTDGFIDEVWDVTEGVPHFVGPTGNRLGVDAGLSYHPTTGLLYNLNGAEFSDISHFWLYTINPETGDAHFVVDNPLIYADSLAINAEGVAYAVDNVFSGRLYRIDLETGDAFLIGNTNFPEPTNVSIDFDENGTLWASDHERFFRINTLTAHVTHVSTMQATSVGFGGLAVLPEFEQEDIDQDGFVGPGDLALLLGAWGDCPRGSCASDINGDGAVGPADLALVLGAWT